MTNQEKKLKQQQEKQAAKARRARQKRKDDKIFQDGELVGKVKGERKGLLIGSIVFTLITAAIIVGVVFILAWQGVIDIPGMFGK